MIPGMPNKESFDKLVISCDEKMRHPVYRTNRHKKIVTLDSFVIERPKTYKYI